ncbi:MAG: HAD-IA family hydrolase [Candidatus Thermoplasmatota archaeon]
MWQQKRYGLSPEKPNLRATLKPDKKIYTIMLDRLDLTPGECVFIDDQKTNVVSAVEMGLYGIVFHNITQCVQDLEKLGISINNKPNTQKRA